MDKIKSTVVEKSKGTTVEKTMQQKRAEFALRKVRWVETHPGLDNGEFRAQASGLPAMVRMSGLGQAMAFCLTKGVVHRQLYDIVSEWLRGEGRVYAGGDDLMVCITSQDMQRYRVAQAETLALLDWVKKFATAYLREQETRPS